MALPVPAYRHPTGSRCPLKHLHFLHTNPTTEAQLWALQRRAMLWCDPGQPPISMSIHPPPGAGFDVVRSHIGNSWTCGAARVPAQSDAKSTLMRARKISWLHPSPPPLSPPHTPPLGRERWLGFLAVGLSHTQHFQQSPAPLPGKDVVQGGEWHCCMPTAHPCWAPQRPEQSL